MKVTLLQTDIVWGSPDENLKRLDRALRSVPGSDLYVLPEMFSTGFVTDPSGIAESGQQSLSWMKSISEEYNAAMAGSVATEQDGRFYNRFYFVRPGQEPERYDKRHLFTFAGEDKRYTAGDRRAIVEWKGVRFLLLICYDLRFPVWARNRSGEYDAIIIVANWPDSRRYAWDTLLKARAIENQCYLLSANRQGNDPGNSYSGGTYLVNPLGEIIQDAGDDNGKEYSSVTFDLDISDLQTKYRPKFPVLNDADRFIIQ